MLELHHFLNLEIIVISVIIDPSLFFLVSRIMYNLLYKYLTTEKRLYSKQFGFQTGLTTEHAIVKLVDQIYKSFEEDHNTLVVFIDLSKASDTADHTILIRKLKMYGIKGINLAWFLSYLTNRIQYISITHDPETDTKNICYLGFCKDQYWDHYSSCCISMISTIH